MKRPTASARPTKTGLIKRRVLRSNGLAPVCGRRGYPFVRRPRLACSLWTRQISVGADGDCREGSSPIFIFVARRAVPEWDAGPSQRSGRVATKPCGTRPCPARTPSANESGLRFRPSPLFRSPSSGVDHPLQPACFPFLSFSPSPLLISGRSRARSISLGSSILSSNHRNMNRVSRC
jgi:hypothetical protein